MDVLIPLSSEEAKTFKEGKMHMICRDKRIQNILPSQHVYVCVRQEPFGDEEYGVLGELKGFEAFILKKYSIWDLKKEILNTSNQLFLQKALKYYNENWLDILLQEPPEWALVFDKTILFEKPRAFHEFSTGYGNPLRNSPQEMIYVTHRNKENHGIQISKEEFIHGCEN